MSWIEYYQNAADFLEKCLPVLCEQEAANCTLIARALAATGPEPFEDGGIFASIGEAPLEGACMIYPQNTVLLSTPFSEHGFDVLAAAINERFGPLLGVFGPAEVVDPFVAGWLVVKGEFAQISTHRCYQLSAVRSAKKVPGAVRRAEIGELDLLCEWTRGFTLDTEIPYSEQVVRSNLASHIPSGQIYLWEDRGPKAMAQMKSSTPSANSLRVVYTPPEYRGMGYASALVAEISQQAINSGKKHCYLFTDVMNPISNRMYQQIGYDVVCDYHEYTFASQKR